MARKFAIKRKVPKVSLLEGVTIFVLLLALLWSVMKFNAVSFDGNMLVVPVLIFLAVVLMFFNYQKLD